MRVYLQICSVNGANIYAGVGSPNGALSAPVGSIYMDKTPPGNVYQNEDGATTWSLVGGGQILEFVWSSGAVSDPSIGLYGTFLEAHTAAAAAVATGLGRVSLAVRGDPVNDEATIEDPGNYDMSNILLFGVSSGGGSRFVEMRIPVGTTFENLLLAEKISLASLLGGGETLLTVNTVAGEQIPPTAYWGPNLYVDGTGTFLRVQGTGYMDVYLASGTEINMPIALDSGDMFLFMQDNSTVAMNMVTSAALTTLNVSSSLYSWTQGFASQAGIAGTLTVQYPNMAFDPANPADWGAPAPTDLLNAVNRMASLLAVLNAAPIP